MGTPITNSPNPGSRGFATAESQRFQAYGWLPPADDLLVDIFIYPTRIENKPVGSDGEVHVVDTRTRRFKGPLAELKQFAQEHSHPGLRFFVSQRKTQGAPTIRVHVRVGANRKSFVAATEAEARRMIERQAQAEQSKPCAPPR